jgi:asparagine synthase (glutamine-hydrolysing)
VFRYIALVWDEMNRPQAQAAQLLVSRLQSSARIWSTALHVPGMHVLYADARPGSTEIHRLNGVDGVVLGTVFEPCTEFSAGALPKKNFSALESQRILASGCRALIASCWGRYVALAHDAATHKSYVLRDPNGGLPCYRACFHGIELYFSSVEDIAALGLLQFTVNWDYIAARVVFVFLHARETALNEVTEVLAGELVQIDRGASTRSFAWDPLGIARTDVIENVDFAAKELRRVALTCIRSWAACYANILHKLSGGLDSSIVLGGLQDMPSRPTLTCLNYYSAGSNSDERTYARMAANRAGVPLLEQERSSALRIEEMLSIARSAAPTFYLGPLQTSRQEARLAREIGATAYFGGAGGDQLFYQAQGILTAADYLRMHGLNRRFVAVSLDAAHLEHCSIWHVMHEAYKRRRSLPPWSARPGLAAHRKLVADRTIATALQRGGFTHPLFESVQAVPPGKLWQAYAVSMPPEFYDPLGAPEDPEPVQPLLSQPLMELCLRIPTYVLTNSGWDRAIARQAFRGEVPREILRRRSKGGVEENTQEILTRNLATARELLLDGQLRKAGLLDPDRVAEVLSDRPTSIPGVASEVFDHLGTEAWLRLWNPT